VSALFEKAHARFLDWLRKVWRVRGGGLYACGFAVTFVILELRSLFDDVLGIGSLFTGQAVEFIVQFFVDSFTNTLRSFAWPLYAVTFAPPWGAIALGIGFAGFATWLKRPIERWLFPEEPNDATGDRAAP